MKTPKTLAALALAASLLAPLAATTTIPAAAQEATPAADCPDLDVARLAELAETWKQAAFTAGALPELDAVLAPDFRYHAGAFPDGLDAAGWQEARAQLAAAYPDGKLEVNRTILDAPYAVMQWTATATQTGEFQGVPATGARVDWDGINIFRFDCGKIAETWAEVDQFGRFEAAPAAPDAAPAAESCGAPAGGDAEVEKLVEAWWATGWNAGDAAAFEEIADDGLVHHWATGEDTVGAAASAERIMSWRASMPDMKIAHDPILVDQDLAAARWTLTGTDTGGVMGAAPTGKAVSVNGINVFRVCDGKIAEVWSEMDAAGMAAQLGG